MQINLFGKNLWGQVLQGGCRQLNKVIQNSFSFSHTYEISDDLYTTQNKDVFKDYYKFKYDSKINGFATASGTKLYSERRKGLVSDKHFKKPFNEDITVSSVGIGTYQGAPDALDDLKMFNAIVDSVKTGGINVIDTAINYRYMKSERVVGAALRFLLEKEKIGREELFVCTKGGYIPEDADQGIPGNVLMQDLIKGSNNQLSQDDIVGGCHCMHPVFLQNQLQTSLNNLGINNIDLYYLHNAGEQQLSLLGEQKFFEKLAIAFEFLEKKVQEGVIKSYGMATWLSFRARPDEEKVYLSLEKVCALAKKVGGQNNKFKYIQVPVNLIMPEVFSQKWQKITNDKGETDQGFLLTAARLCNINVVTSSPLMSGSMIQVPLPTDVFKCRNLGAKHLQFMRSIPSPALLTTLIGQKTSRHVKTNLEVIQHAPLATEEFWNFFVPQKREQKPEEAIDIE